jgi:hypothetical protein
MLVLLVRPDVLPGRLLEAITVLLDVASFERQIHHLLVFVPY